MQKKENVHLDLVSKMSVLKGWVWHIPFYPLVYGNTRTIKDIFWYDSSNEDEFTRHTGAFHILVPESLINAPAFKLKYVRDNKDKFIKNKEPIIMMDDYGNWGLRLYVVPSLKLGY